MMSYPPGQNVTIYMTWTTNNTKLAAATTAGATTITVHSITGYANGDSIAVAPNDHFPDGVIRREQITTVSGTPSGKTITLGTALTTAWTHSAGEVVGELTDPSEITLVIEQPDGTEATYTYGASQITRSSLGIFTRDQTLTAGRWRWKATATISGKPAVLQGEIDCLASVT